MIFLLDVSFPLIKETIQVSLVNLYVCISGNKKKVIYSSLNLFMIFVNKKKYSKCTVKQYYDMQKEIY